MVRSVIRALNIILVLPCSKDRSRTESLRHGLWKHGRPKMLPSRLCIMTSLLRTYTFVLAIFGRAVQLPSMMM